VPASRKLLILGLFVVISLLTRGLFLRVEVLDIDESAHAVGSWILMDGKLLYTDFVNNKPPLLYVYYAIAQWMFGRGLIGVHLFTALFTIPLTAFGASAFFEHSRKGLIAGLLFLLFSATFLAHDMHSSNTEILMILPGTWALVLVRNQQRAQKIFPMFMAGFLLGTGVLLKYQIAAWLAPIALATLWIFWKEKRLGPWIAQMILVSIGFLIPLLAAYFYFYAHGGADAFLYWTIQNNLGYSANPITAREAFGRAASYMLPFLIVTSPLWWFAWRSPKLHESKYQLLLTTFLILFSIPPALIGFRFYPHYFIQLYIPLCLAAAPHANQLLQFPFSTKAKLFCGYVLMLFIGFTIANSIMYFYRNDVYRETDPVFRDVAARLRADSCAENATLFVWGYSPIVYYYSRMIPASRFVVMPQSGLTTYISGNQKGNLGAIKNKHWDWFMEDLKKNDATYIIDTAPSGIYRWDRYPIRNYPRLQQLLRTKYDFIGEMEGMNIYRNRYCRKRSVK
jgi:4-amino-4-deoxy-L-arabinose transferase-like glycosyltransferase